MEQGRRAKDLEQVEGWEEQRAEAAVEEAVLVPVPAAPAIARTVEQRSPTRLEHHALTRNALSAGQL